MIGMWFEDKIFQDVTCTIIYLMVLQIAFFFFFNLFLLCIRILRIIFGDFLVIVASTRQ